MGIVLTRRTFLSAAAMGAAVSLRASSPTIDVHVIPTPRGGVQPQAVVDAKGACHLIFLHGEASAADVFYTHKAAGAEDFGVPIRVNSQPGSAIATGTVRGAHLALGKDGRVHVAWNGSTDAAPKGRGKSTPMLYARLNESGKAFEAQRNLMELGSGLDGGGTLAADHLGNVYVTWHAQGRMDDGMAMQGEIHRRVYLARSTDGGATFSEETAISPAELGACGCCGMGAVTDAQGTLYLAYRNAREMVHRDTHLLISRDHGKSFQAVNVHPWEINACPMSTVSLTAAGGRVWIAWQTDKQVYFAPIDPKMGTPGTPIAAPGSGAIRKFPTLAVNRAGEMLFTWTEGTGWQKGGMLAWQTYDASGRALASNPNAGAVPVWGLPAAISGDRFTVVC